MAMHTVGVLHFCFPAHFVPVPTSSSFSGGVAFMSPVECSHEFNSDPQGEKNILNPKGLVNGCLTNLTFRLTGNLFN